MNRDSRKLFTITVLVMGAFALIGAPVMTQAYVLRKPMSGHGPVISTNRDRDNRGGVNRGIPMQPTTSVNK